MARDAKKLRRGAGEGYAGLLRRYAMRRAMTPSRPPTRRELIEDAAYVEWAAQGNAPLDEHGALLVAMWRLLGLLAAAQGVDMREEARLAADPESLRPRPALPDAPRDEDEETRRAFAPLLARAKRALERNLADKKENR